MVTLILFLVIFGVVVIAHEFGHFLLAKANGIHVVEFASRNGTYPFFRAEGGYEVFSEASSCGRCLHV